MYILYFNIIKIFLKYILNPKYYLKIKIFLNKLKNIFKIIPIYSKIKIK